MKEKHYSPSETEARWQAQWNAWGIYRWNSERPRQETFIVDTPPPTVSGSLHVGHIFSYTHQDILVRYHRMRGKNIFYPMGWDDNGLPTERRVENYFNVRCDPSVPYNPSYTPELNFKKPPEVISRPNFIELCNQMTVEDEKAFKELWSRIGLSVDWSLEYATINEHCWRISQLSFIKLLESGAVYQATAPTMWDVDFRTAVAQAEAEDREVQGVFYQLCFGLEGGGQILVATTRPELLPACVAMVVHPEDQRYKHLVGKSAFTPLFQVRVPIIADDKVEPDKGTGIVMVCTFGDTTDVDWWRDYKLPLRQIISRTGRMEPISFGSSGWESHNPDAANEAYNQIVGLGVEKARSHIVELLQASNALEGEPKPVTRAVKFYEKGNRPLELISTRQWYINILDCQEELLAQGEKISWHPSFMLERYKNWVKGLNQNWCISRQRHFGVPFPVWYPLDTNGQPCYETPIIAPQDRLPIDPLVDVPPGYEEFQRGQPGGFLGDPNVQDTWATSSLTPQIATHWELDSERHAKLFPMDIRPQSHEIIRTWAFYTIAKAWLHDREIPWHHVVISGWILDPDRKKMSKSKGNVVTPLKLIETYSADALRYWTARARAGVDTMYDENVFKIGKRLETKLYNASKFVRSRIENVDPQLLLHSAITYELDRGFINRLREIIEVVTQAYEHFEWADALQYLESFFWSEFCDDYLELVKLRTYHEPVNEARLSSLCALKTGFSVLLRLFAPVLPFITEELWSQMFASPTEVASSIHTSPWPTLPELDDVKPPSAITSYSDARTILSELRREKGNAKVSARTPVDSLVIYAQGARREGILDVLEDICSAQAVAQFQVQNKEGDLVIEVHLAKQDN